MIESDLCHRCKRPYAMGSIGICDSCLKDIDYEISTGKNVIKPDSELVALADELIRDVELQLGIHK